MATVELPDESVFIGRFNQTLLQHWLHLVMAACLLLSPLILACAWWGANVWLHGQAATLLERTLKRNAIEADMADQGLSYGLAQLPGITALLVNTQETLQACIAPTRHIIAELNTLLATLPPLLHIDGADVLDRHGISLADTRHLELHTDGLNLAGRDFVQNALAGRSGYHFSHGPLSKMPGFIYAQPIVQHKQVIGAVLAKINGTTLTHWIKTPNAFVTDHNGVVVLSANPQLLFKVMPYGRALTLPAATLQKRYNRTSFEVLPIAPADDKQLPGALRWGGESTPLVLSERSHPSGLTIHIRSWLLAYPDLLEQWWIIFTGLALGLGAIVWAGTAMLLYSLHARLQSRQLDDSNRRLAHLNEELWHQANHDFLTGLCNRRHFKQQLELACTQLEWDGGMLTLAMLDLDHFKRINDSHGHDVGDEVLAQVARCLVEHAGPDYVVGRLGGEEFAMLIPQASLAQGTAQLEAIRATLERYPLPSSAGPVQVTISAGLACFHPGDCTGQLMQRADSALYAAKRAGRNRVLGNAEDSATPQRKPAA